MVAAFLFVAFFTIMLMPETWQAALAIACISFAVYCALIGLDTLNL